MIKKLIVILLLVVSITLTQFCQITLKATETNIDNNPLEYSEIYGTYHDYYDTYNCYLFAIDRYENFVHFGDAWRNVSHTEKINYDVDYRTQPGYFHSGVSKFNKNENVEVLANIVIEDLKFLGMESISKSQQIPTLNSPNDRLICVRTGSEDYHFMKYIPSEDIWVHKPGPSFPLKYNGSIENGDVWTNEGVDVSSDYSVWKIFNSGSKVYNSEIWFIKYTVPNSINLNCKMSDSILRPSFNPQSDIIYEMNVTCESTYYFEVAGDYINIKIFDEHMENIGDWQEDEKNHPTDLTLGKYYLLIYYYGDDFDDICPVIRIYQGTLCYTILYGNNTVQSLNLNKYDFHKTVDNNIECVFKYMNNNNTGFYKITINNMFDASIRNIEIRDENGRIPQYDYENNNLDPVYTKTIMVYLRNNTEYLLYLNTIESFNDGISINIEYIEYNTFDIDLFNANENVDTVYNLFENISNSSEFVQKIYLNQVGKFKFDISYSSINDSDICIWFVEESELSNKTFNFEFDNLISQNYEQSIILEEGVYYIVGIVQNQEDINLSILLKRIITDSGSDVLIPDPDPLYNPSKTCGSHINVYEKDLPRSDKSYGCNKILKGFTRVIYLDQNIVGACYNSDYYWYSSNNSVATVSSFGTIHAKLVGTVRIMAVNKIDPSKVYVKEFNIVNNSDSNTVSIQLFGEFALSDGEYTLVLTVTNCPYPMIQYYNWTMQKDDDVEADMNGWGIVKANTPGTIILIGDYIYNMNYKIIYTIYLIKDN